MTVYYSSFTPATPTSGVAGISLVDSNSNITINGSGVISGIGTGTGTAVSNAAITVDLDGNIVGIGTGSGTTVDNTKQLWGQISGIGKPESYADVTLTAQVVATPPDNVIINADYLGAIISGQFNKVLTPSVIRGGTSVRTDNRATYSVSNITGGLTGFVSVNNTTGSADKGRVTVTNCTSTGSFQLNILWDSITISSFVIHFTVVPANPPLGGGGGGGTKSGSVDLTGFSYTGTTFVQAGRIDGLVKAAGETIRCSLAAATYQYVHTSSGDRTTTGKFQYSVSGANSWTDVGSAVNGTASFWYAGDFSGDEGSITVTQNVAPSNATYDIRFLVAHTATGGGNSTFSFGTMSVIIGV